MSDITLIVSTLDSKRAYEVFDDTTACGFVVKVRPGKWACYEEFGTSLDLSFKTRKRAVEYLANRPM